MIWYIIPYILLVPYVVNGFPFVKDDLSVVTLPDGKVAGTLQRSGQNKTFYAFFEIPYALPPEGPLRFKEPLPPKKWNGILNNTRNTKICIQTAKNFSRETEDCLYLNVYTSPSVENKPVLVWIHGGSFKEGSGAMDYYGPQFFIDYDIVLVSINYRLGPLGFLSTGDGVIPANLGIKDQLQALKWVQQNIKYFGGNPEEVTLMGQSAGAAAVGYLLMSEQSKGLFRAAIMHSGSPLNCWALQKDPKTIAYQFGSSLDANFTSNNSSEDLLTLLMNAPISKIKQYSTIVPPNDKTNCYLGFNIPFGPVEEPESDRNAIVTGPSHSNIKNGKINKVPVLIGINSQELLLFDLTGIGILAVLLDIDPALIPNNNLNMQQQNRIPAGLEIKQIYTPGNLATRLATSINFGSDSVFTTPVARHAFLQSLYTDVYFYEFSYKGKIGQLLVNKTVEGAEGVGHQEELEYFFENEDNWNENDFPDADLLTRRRVLQLWTDFIKTTNPTPKKLDVLQNITWPKVSQQNFTYLDINTTLTVKTKPKHYEEWSQIIDKYASQPLDTY